jgi:hypothetical protein
VLLSLVLLRLNAREIPLLPFVGERNKRRIALHLGCELFFSKETGRVMPFDHISKQIGWLVEKVNKALKEQAKEAGMLRRRCRR